MKPVLRFQVEPAIDLKKALLAISNFADMKIDGHEYVHVSATESEVVVYASNPMGAGSIVVPSAECFEPGSMSFTADVAKELAQSIKPRDKQEPVAAILTGFEESVEVECDFGDDIFGPQSCCTRRPATTVVSPVVDVPSVLGDVFAADTGGSVFMTPRQASLLGRVAMVFNDSMHVEKLAGSHRSRVTVGPVRATVFCSDEGQSNEDECNEPVKVVVAAGSHGAV
ncbi:hypothetical protein KRX51_03130 [Corynebacterium sp. TAE3-ERU12]|uniref:hypothetical protein n=1 Tax=Corynebacterium sp. TAE3-ERU12 TaxID=2849491 RepID=UPI001C473829|nr:hypothetical protein [Corynebacterium sp. TAE3-ERU12]MBV7294911.1 hypothetical protein [Corynebacterium sp. TAE3-ERU12]